MQILSFLTLLSLTSAAVLAPQKQERRDNNVGRLLPPLGPCAGCTLTCAAVFAGCALFCAIPADPFCEACVVTEDAALGDTCLTCLRTCFFVIPHDVNAKPPTPERQAAIQAAVDNHVVPPNPNPPVHGGLSSLPSFRPLPQLPKSTTTSSVPGPSPGTGVVETA